VVKAVAINSADMKVTVIKPFSLRRIDLLPDNKWQLRLQYIRIYID
jgi:hypothetical protein